MSVPFIDLRRFEDDFLERWAQTCRQITAETRFVGGPDVARLEESLARDNKVSTVVGCANGTDALQLALRNTGVGEGDVVVIPDLTFWATFEAVINCGARAVTVDVDPTDLQMDFDLFRQAVERHRPKAAILVHLYGWGSARLDDFRAYCRELELPLVEDGAQCYGTTWKGAPIYRDAHISTISFYPAKVLGACGDAGAVVCSSEEQAAEIRSLGNHGRAEAYTHDRVGWNSRMSGFDAAFLNQILEVLPQRVETRRRAAHMYRDQLSELGFQIVAPPDGYVENGYLNVTLLPEDQRQQAETLLRGNNIGFANTYPLGVSKQPGVKGFLIDSIGGEVTQRISREVLNLPLFAYIRDEEVSEVVNTMKAACVVKAVS